MGKHGGSRPLEEGAPPKSCPIWPLVALGCNKTHVRKNMRTHKVQDPSEELHGASPLESSLGVAHADRG